jgi:hypothetical protein
MPLRACTWRSSTRADVREADLELRHLGDPKSLAEEWSQVE